MSKTELFSEIICALWGPMKLCLDFILRHVGWSCNVYWSTLLRTDGNNLRLPGTYAAKIDKIRPPLHVSLNNSVTIPYFKNLIGSVLPSGQPCCAYYQSDPL